MTPFVSRLVIRACVLVIALAGTASGHPPDGSGNHPAFLHGFDAGAAEQCGPSVGEFLSAEGGLDLEGIRRSGYQGPLDLTDYDVRMDPQTGRPVAGGRAPEGSRDLPDDSYWQPGPGTGVAGVNGSVNAALVYDNLLIVGGRFTIAGNVFAENIACWDGTSWSALGSGMSGSGPTTRVHALAVYDNAVIAAGSFTTAGGVAANRIARWDGVSWSALGSGMNGTVHALTFYDDALIAGGSFTIAGADTARMIARWDGASWSALGSGMSGATAPKVSSLAVYDGDLIAGGEFNYAGDVSARYIARWDGASWSALGAGMGGLYEPDVAALAVFEGALIAGGRFLTAGGQSARRVARWDGASWSAMGEGMSGTVYALAVYEGALIAGGFVFAQWDGAEWISLGGAGVGAVYALTVNDDALIAGGSQGIRQWDGLSWSAPGQGGINSSVLALAVYDNALIAGGWFTEAGGVAANQIARWDGVSWSALGSGMNGGVHALAVYDNALIAAGSFTSADGVPANRVARWDGTSWSALDSGLEGGSYPFTVNALTVHDGALFAGGYFSTAGGVAAEGIARWDGASWSALGSGMNGVVCALAVFDGALIAGGGFTEAGGVPASRIARWDGVSWSALGMGLNDSVISLAVYDNALVAGGHFESAGGWPHFGRIAMWDGTSWWDLGDYGMIPCLPWPQAWVGALAVYDGRLIAGGYFCDADYSGALNIAAWLPGWTPLGSGVGDPMTSGGEVAALAVYNNALFVGGSFETAGGKVSPYLAVWNPDASNVDYILPPTIRAVPFISAVVPNPFNPGTTVWLDMPRPDVVTLAVHDLSGRLVRTLFSGSLAEGRHPVSWDGFDEHGNRAASGIYLVRPVTADGTQRAVKITLVK